MAVHYCALLTIALYAARLALGAMAVHYCALLTIALYAARLARGAMPACSVIRFIKTAEKLRITTLPVYHGYFCDFPAVQRGLI